MPQEYSAGAVIFHRSGNTIKYLLLKHIAEATSQPGYWGFSKGHIEPGENLKQTTIREVEEETSLKDLLFIDGFQEKVEFFFKRKKHDGQYETIYKEVIFHLVESKSTQVAIPLDSHEHCEFVWLEYDEAMKRATHENSKRILNKANNLLKSLPAITLAKEGVV